MNAAVEPSYKYDVAFSFLNQDEGLVRQLSNSFAGRLSTFVYSEQQKELGGKDGVEIFSRVFKSEARIVVILYRSGWGETKWTRVESSAIQERFLNQGHEFLLIVPVEESPKVPAWFPETRIWLDLKLQGLPGVSGIIEYRVRERGGEPRVESAVERAARLQQLREIDETEERFRESEQGVETATDHAQQVVLEIERLSQEVSASNKGFALHCGRPSNVPARITWEVSSYGFKVLVAWFPTARNSLRGANFQVKLLRLSKPYEGTREELDHHVFEFRTIAEGVYGWKDTSDSRRSFSSAQLADFCVKLLLDALEENKPWQVR